MLVKVDVAPLYKGLLPWQIKTDITLLIQSQTQSTSSRMTLDVQGTALFSSSICKTSLIPEWKPDGA